MKWICRLQHSIWLLRRKGCYTAGGGTWRPSSRSRDTRLRQRRSIHRSLVQRPPAGHWSSHFCERSRVFGRLEKRLRIGVYQNQPVCPLCQRTVLSAKPQPANIACSLQDASLVDKILCSGLASVICLLEAGRAKRPMRMAPSTLAHSPKASAAAGAGSTF